MAGDVARLQADLDVARGDLDVATEKNVALKGLLGFYERALHDPVATWERVDRDEFERLVVAASGPGDVGSVWTRTLDSLRQRAKAAVRDTAFEDVLGIFVEAVRDPGAWYAYQRRAVALIGGGGAPEALGNAIEAVIKAIRDAAFYRAALHDPAAALTAASERGGEDLLAVQRLASVPSVLQESAAALRAEGEARAKAENGLAYVRGLLDSAIDGALR